MKFFRKSITLLFMMILAMSTSINTVSASSNIRPTIYANPNHEGNYISLNWEINDKSQPYRYQIYRVHDGKEDFTPIRTKGQAKVLNIYPVNMNGYDLITNTGLSEGQIDLEGKTVPDSGILKTWLLKENIDDVLIDTVSLTDFNSNPSKYLKKVNGKWNYDAVFYGMWNLRPEKVYPNDKAIEHLRVYIHDGGGFMTSHHTIGYTGLDRGVNKLAKELGVEIFSNQPKDFEYQEYVGQYPDGRLFPTVSFVIPDGSRRDYSKYWPEGNRIKIVRDGFLTEYPFKVGKVGTEYDIPHSHGLNVFAKGQVWVRTVNPTGYRNQEFIELTVSPATGEKGTNNFFVHTYNNTAIINSGHSFPQISQVETRIIANTLYYLSQISADKKWDDKNGKDITPPEKPEFESIKYNKKLGKLEFKLKDTKDIGTTYNYYVKATSFNNDAEYTSDTAETTITSGFKGYSIVIDDKPNTIPDLIIDSTDGKYEADVSYNKDFYIHVAAIDNQNNISVTHYKVHEPNISIKATSEDWTNEDVTLTIEAEFIDKVILPNGITVETDKPITYTVQENGMYTFIGLNEYGEIMNIATFVVENIDRVAKDILITPSDDKWRNKDIEVRIKSK